MKDEIKLVSCNSYDNIPYACLGGTGSIQKAWICPWEGFSFTGFTNLYELQPYNSQEQTPDPTEYGIEIWYEEHMNRLYWIRKKNEYGSLPGIFNNKTMIVDAIMSKLDTNWLLKHKRNKKLERLEMKDEIKL